ncbi:MAG: group II intron reverse transcriptase domain-containing protein [Patescibacteria group bacterium]|nr:group II intron reverse transcriptase domain-containing protein [Patescibacteria group bacterium]
MRTVLGRVVLSHTYKHIISVENLLEAWQEFLRRKRRRVDVMEFERELMSNIFQLHKDLANKTYVHSPYVAFNISDPKPRNIHKAAVRDRLLHHALYRALYPFFDKTFIFDSYSCRKRKGTHKALNRFHALALTVSRNHTRTVWVLKCDIRKFFASIDQSVLIEIVKRYIPDQDIVWLISGILDSFYSTEKGVGLPLGNLTSQLLVNVYMNEFDQFVKHKLKARYYIRYADDFVVLSEDREWLASLLPRMDSFLHERLRLTLHPDKISLRTLASGVDFLGWVHFPDHRVMRTTTKRRVFRGIKNTEGKEAAVQSYLGLMSHGNTKKEQAKVRELLEKMGKNAGGGRTH